jgi:hypothetical protein
MIAPGLYIVTRDGVRGYVLRECPGVPDMWEIRTAGGVTVRCSSDLSPDPLMAD